MGTIQRNISTKVRAVGLIYINTNLLLTEREGRTGEYWPEVVAVRTSLRSVRTVTTSGQYSPVRPSRSVSKRLVFMLITPTGLTLVETFFRIVPMAARLIGLISKAKEYQI